MFWCYYRVAVILDKMSKHCIGSFLAVLLYFSITKIGLCFMFMLVFISQLQPSIMCIVYFIEGFRDILLSRLCYLPDV